jgi:hypothetical protein
MYSRVHHFAPPPTMKTKLSFKEIEIIIQSKSRNLTWKVIANIVASKPETVRCAYRFLENLSNSIPKRLSEVITNKGKATSY